MSERDTYFPPVGEPFELDLPAAFINPPDYDELPQPTRSRRVQDRFIRNLLRGIDQTKVHDLDQIEITAIAARWFNNKTNVEIAVQLGISPRTVSDVQKRGLVKLGVLKSRAA